MDDNTEVIAIFIDEGAEAADISEIDLTATSCLLRDATGVMSIEPTRSPDTYRQGLEHSGVFRRGTPIVDPGSGDVIGYELEEIEPPRVAVG